MNEPLHDRFERRLREDGHSPLPDEGFTQRVALALPPRRRTLAWLGPALLLGSAALGAALAWTLAPAGASVAQGFLDLARLQSQTPSAAAALGTALAMAVIATVLVAEES